ncbi:MAG TPA: ABC transporter substrate-binding protein [Streptosporangiaceae bacterium]|nr:ABC transporter substrate-binding protein [Streptosporangiaceae bacterium]
MNDSPRGSPVQLVRAPAHIGVLGRALRRVSSSVALLSLALAAVACGTGSSAVLPSGRPLTVAVVPGIDTVPLMVGVKDGLFHQHGIAVSVRDYPSAAAAYTALNRGTVDVAAGDYAAFFYAISLNQARLKFIMDGYDAAPGAMQVLTLPTSGINSPQDLAGKAVATPDAEVAPYQGNFPYNIQTLATEAVLQSDGVSPTEISWREMPATRMINALKNHVVSAILVTEPLIVEAETQLGAVEVLDSCSGVTANLPLSGYFSTSAFASQHSAALLAFRTALIAAQADAQQRGNVQPVLRGEGMTPLEAALANVGQYPALLNVGQVQRVADLMYDSGMITNAVSVPSLLLK